MRSPLQRQIASRAVSLHLTARNFWISLASDLRTQISKTSGDNGSPNRYPISGGLCQHWSDAQKNAVIHCVTQANEATERALHNHLNSGRHARTFRALINS